MSQAVALLEQDAKALRGVRYARKSDDLCHRGDGDQASVVLEGARYAVRGPRVRRATARCHCRHWRNCRAEKLLRVTN